MAQPSRKRTITEADWQRAVADADAAADESDESPSSDDESVDPRDLEAWLAELPRPTTSRKRAHATLFLRAEDAKTRALQKAGPLLPPVESGGACGRLPAEVLEHVLLISIDSLEDFASILQTCRIFNHAAALSAGVCIMVGHAATAKARAVKDEATETSKRARELLRENAGNVWIQDLDPGRLTLHQEPSGRALSYGIYTEPPGGEGEPDFSSTGTFNQHGREEGKCCVKYHDGAYFWGELVKGERHGRGVELFSEAGRSVVITGSWRRDKRHGLCLLENGDTFDGQLGLYKWDEPYGVHLCWGKREAEEGIMGEISGLSPQDQRAMSKKYDAALRARAARHDVHYVFFGPEPKKKPKIGADGYVRR